MAREAREREEKGMGHGRRDQMRWGLFAQWVLGRDGKCEVGALIAVFTVAKGWEVIHKSCELVKGGSVLEGESV